MKKLLLLSLALFIVSAWQIREWALQKGPLQEETFVLIPRGAGVQTTAKILADYGVVDREWLVRLVARLKNWDKELKAGEYAFQPHISLYNALQKIVNGDIYYRKITFAEGLTTAQILALVAAEPYLSGDITLHPHEGELLPETYNFIRGDSKDSIIQQAMTAMHKALADNWQQRAAGLPLKTPQEMLTLASIVEKETGVAEERGLVASVFTNRLHKGMKLQTDPTVIYALTHGQNELERQLTKKDLQTDSPYNTYQYYGLPPTPICNPGQAALKAVAHPETSDYLYFVANGRGGHNFAENLTQHNRNVQSYRQKR